MKSIGATPQQLWNAIALVALLLAACSESKNAPANSLPELYAELLACLNVPPAARGSEITIVFSINHDGSLLSRPRVFDARFLGWPSTQNEFVASALAAFQKCLPLSVSKKFGGAMAGKPILLRIIPKRYRGLVNAHAFETDGVFEVLQNFVPERSPSNALDNPLKATRRSA